MAPIFAAAYWTGVLDDSPLRAVRRPDTDSLTLGDPEGHQRPSDEIDLGVQFAVAPAAIAGDVNNRFGIRICPDDPFEVLPDSLLDNRGVGRTRGV